MTVLQTCSECGQQKPDTYYVPQWQMYLCPECYEELMKGMCEDE